jgi:PAS domain S-box-containing protein
MIWPIIRPFAWFLFSPAVFFSAWVGGRRLGIFASAIATLLIWYFFLPPERSFVERTGGELVAALTFLGTGVVFSLFHDRLKRAEQKAAEAIAASRYQAQLESVFQAIRDGIVVTDTKGTFLLVNEAEARINGFPSAEAMKQKITFFHDLYELRRPDGKTLPFDEWPINKVLKGESIENLELHARRPDTGQEWFISFSGEPIRDAQGRQILAVVVSHDITEQKRAEDSLRASESRFRATFENAAVGIARVAPDGHWLEVNQRLCGMLGYARDELQTKTFGDVTHPDDLEVDWNQRSQLLAGEIESYSMEKRYYRKDGSMVWGALTVSLSRKADGSPDYFISVVRDISTRKQAEEKLRASEQQFRILADTAPVLIWISGPDKLCTFFNRPWLDFTGRTMEQELGNGWTEGIHPDDYDRCLKLYATSFEAREPFRMEYRLRRCDQDYRWILDHGVPRFSSTGEFLGYIGSCIDITESKEVETALRESESRFRQLSESLPQLVWTCRAEGPWTTSAHSGLLTPAVRKPSISVSAGYSNFILTTVSRQSRPGIKR